MWINQPPFPRWPLPRQPMERNEHEVSDQYESALGRAIAQWRTGRPIPMTLAAELMQQGYDVPALEARHMT